MPESVTDRPTKAHEYIFLLSKAASYYYDADAIAEPIAASQVGRIRADVIGGASWSERGQHSKGGEYASIRPSWQNSLDWESQTDAGEKDGGDVSGRVGTGPADRRVPVLEHRRHEIYTGQATKDYASAGAQDPSETKRRVLKAMADPEYAGRNARSVWTITTQPYPEAHFATFPEAIPERCIKAGSRLGDTVLDPFLGSGTTGQVAIQLGRSFVGIELNASYASLARQRIGGAAPLFAAEA
jgi:hypothetical protein